MAFLGNQSITNLIQSGNVISPLYNNRIKNGAYELALGKQVFETGSKPRIVKTLKNREKVYIDPGQFALLLTEEKVRIPDDKIAFISIKAKVKFEGLVNVSGFHVDPGFEGHLLFSVYNAGPSTIVLSRGTPYFPIWFAELDQSQSYTGSHINQSEIPDEPVRALSQGEIASPNELSRRIDEAMHFKTRLDWVVVAIFTILVGLLINEFSQTSNLKEAIEYGYKKRDEELKADTLNSKISSRFNQVNNRIDSLDKSKKSNHKPVK